MRYSSSGNGYFLFSILRLLYPLLFRFAGMTFKTIMKEVVICLCMYCKLFRDYGATLRLGTGTLVLTRYWGGGGGTTHLFLTNSLKSLKYCGGEGGRGC